MNPIPRAPLEESTAPADPYVLFQRWYDDAVVAGLALPNAMTLATVGAEGRPAARMVLLKGIEDSGFVFYTNYESRKGRELTAHPSAALVLHWAPLERQVRIEGSVERVSEESSTAYFATRPLGSRYSATASPQSSVIPDRAWLEEEAASVARRYGENMPRPPHWGGYRVRPDMIEFWQGRSDRLHDRLSYRRRTDNAWLMERLAP
ncbi:MAG: pyridoxamine 5'-phosphate oxidase [Betaproteobacteria bacterium]|nr:pyridoxamine 5'-phosphate oxidase [Betaproteobacteria bacterium]